MAIVIADTSPLQYLFQVGRLDVLRELYGSVLVPDAVRDELLVGRSLGVAVPDPVDFTWMTIRPSTTHASVEPLEDLGAGERAALSLALEISDATVILDDAAARAAAATLNISTTGTLGVGELEQHGFRIAPALLVRVLAIAGEDK